MSRALLRQLVFLLALVGAPGMLEALEDVVHLALEGHTVHDEQHHDAAGDHDDADHGPAHAHASHSHVDALASNATLGVGAPALQRGRVLIFADDLRASGYLAPVFRPPAV